MLLFLLLFLLWVDVWAHVWSPWRARTSIAGSDEAGLALAIRFLRGGGFASIGPTWAPVQSAAWGTRAWVGVPVTIATLAIVAGWLWVRTWGVW